MALGPAHPDDDVPDVAGDRVIPGYDAGGLWLHDPVAAIEGLSAIGYRSVTVRGRRGSLNPWESNFADQWHATLDAAQRVGCQLVVDADATYVLDPWVRQLPSLASLEDDIAAATVRWLGCWIDAASLGNAITLMITVPAAADLADATGTLERHLECLAERIDALLDRAAETSVSLALRPVCGGLIDSVAAWERFGQWLRPRPSSKRLALAAETGAMVAAGEWPLVARLQRCGQALRVVCVSDWPPRSGHGSVDVPRLLAGLKSMGYGGAVIIRNEGLAAAGLQPAQQAAAALMPALGR